MDLGKALLIDSSFSIHAQETGMKIAHWHVVLFPR